MSEAARTPTPPPTQPPTDLQPPPPLPNRVPPPPTHTARAPTPRAPRPRLNYLNLHKAPLSPSHDPNHFLSQVEETVRNVLQYNGNNDISELRNEDREAVGVARHLDRRLQALRRNNDCPRCWMQQAHCICHECPPLDTELRGLNRIFLLMHHKEIGMKVDTAKLIMAAFPDKCRLVVAGIGSDYQNSMKEMIEAMDENNKCLVLFPDETAHPLKDVVKSEDTTNLWDLVVIDGTWVQARKMHTRYIPPTINSGPRRVQLSKNAVAALEQPQDNASHQLRRHSVTWRQVGTFEATRLFLKDLHEFFPSVSTPVFEHIQNYQEIANVAARIELGPPRQSKSV